MSGEVGGGGERCVAEWCCGDAPAHVLSYFPPTWHSLTHSPTCRGHAQVLTVQCPPGAMPGQQIPVQVPPPQMQAGPMGAPPVVRVRVRLGLGLGLGLP